MSKEYDELVESGNLAIADAAMKCEAVFHSHSKAVVTVSGGADSDVVVDIAERVRTHQPIDVTYVWFDTGLEYQATKDHLRYLENRYGIDIVRQRALSPIPKTCKDDGQPFLSKYVSTQIWRLQRAGFDWSDGPYEELSCKWPYRGSLKWWTNEYQREYGKDQPTSFDIGRNKLLREFMLENPPTFKVGANCCRYAKKDVLKHFLDGKGFDLNMSGVRRAEGGVRSVKYKACFTQGAGSNKVDDYRPIFWFTNDDRLTYESRFGIVHSRCYSEYGLERTGCVGCPFGKKFEAELYACERFEPNLAKAVKRIFRESYEYTRKYAEFVDERSSGQMRLMI